MSRKNERGMVLIIALVLAVLYFGLMELLLIDSSQALNEAQRYRARVVALTLAENGAELAAEQLVNRSSNVINTSDEQGSMTGRMTSSGNDFEIVMTGTSAGVMSVSETVTIRGRIVGSSIAIDQAEHIP